MHGIRFPAGAALALLVAACAGGENIGSAEGELRVLPAKLVYDGYVGHASEHRVRLQNTGLTELIVQVAIEGPFQTESGPYRLAGAADITKAVSFLPGAPGEAEGVVRYTVGSQVSQVQLVGHAVIPKNCVAAGPCYDAWFDTASGECLSRTREDGESCSTGNACLVDGVCRNHECLGKTLDCDDGDPCTDDRCDPATGCLNPVTICAPPDNVCEQAYCEKGVGCRTRSDDGKACGESNDGCKDRYRCLARKCERFSVPDGAACFDACGQGKCQDQVCVRETPEALDETPGWTSQPVAADREVFFPGLVDEDGTVVWLEPALDGSNTLLAAAAPIVDGSRDDPPFEQRYRDEVILDGVPGRAGAMLTGELVVVALDGLGGSRLVEARLRADGTRAWGPVDVATLLALEPPVRESLEVLALVDAGGGAVRVVSTAGGRTSVLALGADGTPGQTAWFEGTPYAGDGEPVAIADTDGRLYLTLQRETKDRHVVSLWGDLSGRWATEASDDEGGPLAVANGLLVIAPGRVLRTDNGSWLFDLPVPATSAPGVLAQTTLLGETAGFAIRAGSKVDPPVLFSYVLASTDPPAGTELSANELVIPGVSGNGSWTPPVLTTRNNAVVAVRVATTVGAPVSGLLEFRTDGETARACLIPELGALAGPPAIEGGWFAFAERHGAVKFYELRRGAEPADVGWAGPQGGPSGGNKERR